MIEYSAGIVTAYGSAVRAGYTGTYEDFCRQQAQYADNASAVEQAKQTAVSASQSADQAKQDAQTASTTAQQSAQSAQGSAQSAGQSAQDAQTAKNNAQTYAQSASQSAGSAQQSAQSAQAVLESIPEGYSDLSEDVDQLKADLADVNESLVAESVSEDAMVNPKRFTEFSAYSDTISIRMSGKYITINGTNSIGYLRLALWNAENIMGISSVPPSYANVPSWYSAISDFKIRHTYRYSVKLISGTIADTTVGGAGLLKFLDIRTQSEIMSQWENGEFYCSELPEMICFQFCKGTYTDAVYKIEIEDITELDVGNDNTTVIRHAVMDRGTVGVTDKLKLFFITDLHADPMAIDCLSKYANEHTAYIDEIINGGDTAKYEFSSGPNVNYFNSDLAEKALSVIGNHDSATHDSNGYNWWGKTQTEVYDKWLAPYITNWGVTQPDDAATNGYNYYYKDYAVGVRIIFLDAMFWDATQLAWLVEVLESARTSSLSVIAVAHAIDGLFTGDTDCAWTFRDKPSETSYSGNYARFDGTASGAINDFITAGGEFICWLTGHSHLDRIGHMTNYPAELVLNMVNSGTKEQDMRGAYYSGTFVIVDKTNKLVKLIRCGCNYDMYLKQKHLLCINYSTQTIISQEMGTQKLLSESEIQQLINLLN